ncbi:MAG: MaoC family dehydratase [Desulfobacterales bacterium]|nr:MaoC family dehydratase [Desulfobacterales bacterium]
MPDKSLIGKETPPGTAEAIKKEMIAFCKSIGDNRPEYVDEEVAAKSHFGTIVAPPTYPMRFLFDALDPDLFFELDLNLAGIVHAEQEFIYERPVKAGEQLTITGEVHDIWEKQGRSGLLDFVTFEAKGYEQTSEELVFTAYMTLISRRLDD